MTTLENKTCPYLLRCREENKIYKENLLPEAYEKRRNPISENCHKNYGGHCEEHIEKNYSGLL